MMNPDDHSHDPDLRGQPEPPGGHVQADDYGAQGGPGQLGIIFPAQAQVSSVTACSQLTCSCRNIENQIQKVNREKVLLQEIKGFLF